MSQPDQETMAFAVNFNFQGTTLPTGAPTPRLVRGAFAMEIEEFKLSKEKNGVNFVLSVAPGQSDPVTGKAINPTGYRKVRTFAGFPKPDAEPEDRDRKKWLAIFCAVLSCAPEQLQAHGAFTTQLGTVLGPDASGRRKQIAIDFTPEGGQSRTLKDETTGKERTYVDDAVWIIGFAEIQAINARIRAEASVAAHATAPAAGGGLPMGGGAPTVPVMGSGFNPGVPGAQPTFPGAGGGLPMGGLPVGGLPVGGVPVGGVPPNGAPAGGLAGLMGSLGR